MADVGLGIVTLFAVLLIAILVTRIAGVALTLTGMAEDAAKFQARSAFMGVGFTTREAEQIVNHPVRRRIVMWLMLFGNAGVVTAIVSLILSFSETPSNEVRNLRLLVIMVGVLVLWLLTASKSLERIMHNLITRALRRIPSLDTHDYVALLDLHGDYAVTEVRVNDADWIAGRTLAEARLRNEGLMVLGIQRRHGRYVGAPRGDTQIKTGDTLFAYGRRDAARRLEKRPWGHLGDREHAEAVLEEQVREREETE